MAALLTGDPDIGKTMIALAIATDVTRGRVPLSNRQTTPGNVLYLTVENTPEHVLRPRFDRLDGDATRFKLLAGTLATVGEQVIAGKEAEKKAQQQAEGRTN